MRKVRFNDVRAAYLEQKAEIDAAMEDVLSRGDFINGRAVGEFEANFAKYCGAAYCVGTSNGTSALHLALVAAGVLPGDEVITTAMTFIATSEAVAHAGAKVVFADIDPGTLNLDARRLERALSPRTRAVIFVHLHGNPTGIREVADFAHAHKLILIEDCAQAHGARLAHIGKPVHVGNFGAAGAFSFFPGKNIGAFGDAGALITNDAEIARRARMLANHGRKEKYTHEVEGYNYRLDTLQAAVLSVKLKNLESQVARRNAVATRYEEKLRECGLGFQGHEPSTTHARHLFVIQTEQREELQAHLKANGVETGIHYPIPLHLQPAYQMLGYKKGELPIAERIADTGLSLPMYPQLPLEDVDYVADVVCSYF